MTIPPNLDTVITDRYIIHQSMLMYEKTGEIIFCAKVTDRSNNALVLVREFKTKEECDDFCRNYLDTLI